MALACEHVALGQLPWIVREIREFEGEFFCCAWRGITIAVERRDDLLRYGDDAAFFAPVGLEAAGAE